MPDTKTIDFEINEFDIAFDKEGTPTMKVALKGTTGGKVTVTQTNKEVIKTLVDARRSGFQCYLRFLRKDDSSGDLTCPQVVIRTKADA